MTENRKWRSYPKQLANELNSMAGVAGIGGAILSVVSLIGLTGNIATVSAAIGIAITTLASVIAMWRAVPAKQIDPRNLVGKRVKISDLSNIDPPLRTLGIMGPRKTGKSTLVSRILTESPPGEMTVDVEAHVATLQTSPPTIIALIDGRGHMYAEQFAVAALSEFLYVLLDHNESDSELAPSTPRINKHIEFSEQLRGYLLQHQKKVHHIHLLMNKRDLWEQTSDRTQIVNTLREETDKWTQANLAATVASMAHSNKNADDVVSLIQQIKKQIVNNGRHRT